MLSPMIQPYVMGLSYHRWLEIAVMLFFLVFILYAVIGELTGHEQSREEEVYGKTDIKRNMYLLPQGV
jgi:hypothetical protein